MKKSLVWLPLLFAASLSAEEKMTVVESADTIDIRSGEKLVLSYHKSPVPPPEGVDPIYTRSGFIHPLAAPDGSVVTGIHPDDHFHHLGLWHVWVKTKHKGHDIDFWNLKEKTGTLRYGKTISIDQGDEGAGFTVEQEHVAFPGQEEEEVILRETFRVFARTVDGAYEIDYDTEQTNVTTNTLELPAYRYGGPIAYRAPHEWDKSNSDYLSSEGKTRVDGHETRSRWCAFWGPGKEGAVHLAILGHPNNHDAPQRMRVWPPDSNNGAIFFNYVPIQETGWTIEPGQTSVMRYRLVVQEGKPNADELNERWGRFAK